MNRSTFVKQLFGASLLPVVTLAHSASPTIVTEAQRVRQELLEAWRMSEKMSLITVGQMPAEHFGFKYSPEAMSYSQQWLHCCSFTIAQLANRFSLETSSVNESEGSKEQVIVRLKEMYRFVNETIKALPDASLFEEVDYVGDLVAGWRLLSILENHITHHRGQCMVYLRLSGVTPEGYLGW